MAAPYMTLISTQTVGAGGAASINFSGIPQSFSDIQIVLSGRSSRADTNDEVIVRFNGSTTGYSYRELQGNGSTASSFGNTNNGIYRGAVPAANYTANTFSNNVIYIPNYSGSTTKSASIDTTAENNGTGTRMTILAGLWSGTAAINQVTLTPEVGSFVQYSTASLYGIKTDNVLPSPKATGGDISYSGGYWYHAFKSSGTFTPSVSLTTDVLIVSGGGNGGGQSPNSYAGYGGGGAGGVLLNTGVSVTSAKTVTVGGAGSTSGFTGLTSPTAGGNGGRGNDNAESQGPGSAGGSGGGAGGTNGRSWTPAGGAGVSGQGYAGGAAGPELRGAGGGGAGGAASDALYIGAPYGTGGGPGTNAYAAWAPVTALGYSGYIAGGGGGTGAFGGAGNTGGGSGGGGGGTYNGVGGAGAANTGSGGGASGNGSAAGGSGGSGIVIVRYLA